MSASDDDGWKKANPGLRVAALAAGGDTMKPAALPRHRLVYSCAEHEDCREHPEIGVACWRDRVGPPVAEPEIGLPTVHDGDTLDADLVNRLLATVERQRRALRAQEMFHRGTWTAAEANAYKRTGLEPA